MAHPCLVASHYAIQEQFPSSLSYLPCTFFAVTLFFMDCSAYSSDRQWRTKEIGSGGGSKSVEDRGQGSGGGSPLVRGSGGSCNFVQEILFHIVKSS
jgi:hypothetical protein